MTYLIPSRLYDIIKFIVTVVMPAVSVLYVGLAGIWGWPYADAIAKTTAVVCTLLGALLGISTAEYNKTADYTGAHEKPEEPADYIEKIEV